MIRTSSIPFWFSLAIIASIAFYNTTDHVQSLEQKLRSLNASIENEQQNIHVLNAEWVYLANPERVEAEARKHLTALRPTAPQQVARMGDIAEMLPTREESMTSVAVNSMPIGNIRSSLTAPHVVASLKKPKGTIAVASIDTGHINERMILQHVATAPSSPDTIGSLISELGTHQ